MDYTTLLLVTLGAIAGVIIVGYFTNVDTFLLQKVNASLVTTCSKDSDCTRHSSCDCSCVNRKHKKRVEINKCKLACFSPCVCADNTCQIFPDIAYCNELKNAYLKYKCYAYQATKENNIEICRRISSETFKREYCLRPVILSQEDTSICDEIEASYKDFCLTTLASNLNRPDICEVVGDNHYRNLCFHYMGSNLEDEALCERIEGSALREKCIGNIRAEKNHFPEITK